MPQVPLLLILARHGLNGTVLVTFGFDLVTSDAIQVSTETAAFPTRPAARLTGLVFRDDWRRRRKQIELIAEARLDQIIR